MIALRFPGGLLVVALLFTPSVPQAQGAPKAIAEVKAARLAQNAVLASHQMDSAASFWASDVIITAGLARCFGERMPIDKPSLPIPA